MKFKMNDKVETPGGPGKIISIPAGPSSLYTVLHENKRGVLYDKALLKKAEDTPAENS